MSEFESGTCKRICMGVHRTGLLSETPCGKHSLQTRNGPGLQACLHPHLHLGTQKVVILKPSFFIVCA